MNEKVPTPTRKVPRILKGRNTSPRDFLTEGVIERRELEKNKPGEVRESSRELKTESTDNNENKELKSLAQEYKRTKAVLRLTTETFAKATLANELVQIREAARLLAKNPDDMADFSPSKTERKEARIALEHLRMEMLGHLLQIAGSSKQGPGVIDDYVRRAEEIHRAAGLGQEEYSLLKPFHDAKAEQEKASLEKLAIEEPLAEVAPVSFDDEKDIHIREYPVLEKNKEYKASSRFSRWSNKYFLGRSPEITEQLALKKKATESEAKKPKEKKVSTRLGRWYNKSFFDIPAEETERRAKEKQAEKESERQSLHKESSRFLRWYNKSVFGISPEETEMRIREEKKEQEERKGKSGGGIGRFARGTVFAGVLGLTALANSDKRGTKSPEEFGLPKKEANTMTYVAAQKSSEQLKAVNIQMPSRQVRLEAPETKNASVARSQAGTENSPSERVSLFDPSKNMGAVIRTPDKKVDSEMFAKFGAAMKGVHYWEEGTYSKALQTLVDEYHLSDISPLWHMKPELEVPKDLNEEDALLPQTLFETVDYPGMEQNTLGLQNHLSLSTTTLNWMALSQENFNWGVASLMHEYIHSWQRASAGIKDHGIREAQAHFFTGHANLFSKWRMENYRPLRNDGTPDMTKTYPEVSANFPEIDSIHRLTEDFEFEKYYESCSVGGQDSLKAMHQIVLEEIPSLFDKVDDSHKFWYAGVFERAYLAVSSEKRQELKVVHEKVIEYTRNLAGISDANEWGAVAQYFTLYPETLSDWLKQNNPSGVAPKIYLPRTRLDDESRQKAVDGFERYYDAMTPEAKRKFTTMNDNVMEMKNSMNARSMVASR